jgi:hypothetical protein
LKLQERGSDNCEKAFRAWLRYNEKSKILAQEKHALTMRNLEIEKKKKKKKIQRLRPGSKTGIKLYESWGWWQVR